MIKKERICRVGDRPFILSATLPGERETPFWYVFDGEFRHYQLFNIGVVRGANSISFTVTILLLLLAISWPAPFQEVRE